MTKALLLVEDNASMAALVQRALVDSGEEPFVVERVRKCSEARQRITSRGDEPIAVVITSLFLPDSQGIGTLDGILEVSPFIPILVLANADHEQVARLAMRRGAQDYVLQHRLDEYQLPRILHNMLHRAAHMDALLAQSKRAQHILNSLGDAVVTTDAAGNVTYLNHVAMAMTGWTLPEVLGRKFEETFRIVDGATMLPMYPIAAALHTHASVKLTPNALLMRRDGVESAIEDSVAPICDPHGRVSGAVMVFRDVTQSRAATLRMSHLAQHDALTDLPNRLLLNDRLVQAMAHARRHCEYMAVLYVDIDRFKHVNDTLGHSIGDQLLLSIAKRLTGGVRSSDTVSRQGGDEFVILLTGLARPEDAALSAQKILSFMTSTHHVAEHDLHVTASIGISVFPDDGDEPGLLVTNADKAMFDAKQQGRNTYGFFRPHLNELAIERRFLERGLRRALEREEFVLYYQPIMDLQTEALVGAEALIRWCRTNRQIILPEQFIPGAEQCGCLVPIGTWMLREACRQARGWMDAGLTPIPVSVNISASELRSTDFAGRVRDILQQCGLDPRYLKLEVTEADLVKHYHASAAAMHDLKDLGVTLALDHFGRGFSPLAYLQRFPLDALKIDRSLISGLCINPSDTSIVNAVISTGKSFQLRVIAQGVETREQFCALRDQQCAAAQGPYFREPVTAKEFAKLLEVETLASVSAS
jgi:diguanylate cyclase (GGDEF)-like protein/PAS domain S-box-containing protein